MASTGGALQNSTANRRKSLLSDDRHVRRPTRSPENCRRREKKGLVPQGDGWYLAELVGTERSTARGGCEHVRPVSGLDCEMLGPVSHDRDISSASRPLAGTSGVSPFPRPAVPRPAVQSQARSGIVVAWRGPQGLGLPFPERLCRPPSGLNQQYDRSLSWP